MVRRLTKGGGGVRGRGLAVRLQLYVAFPHFPKNRFGLASWPSGGPQDASIAAGRAFGLGNAAGRQESLETVSAAAPKRRIGRKIGKIVVQPGTLGPSR